jgi:ferredoxin
VGDLRLYVDPDECEANAVCVGIAPEMFDLDDEDSLHVLVEHPVGPDQVARARDAVDSCPKRALFLKEVPVDGGAA